MQTNHYYEKEVLTMKKICSILLALVLLIVPMAISVSAAGDLNANEQKIVTELKKELKIGNKTFAIPKEYVTEAENYFKTIDVSEAERMASGHKEATLEQIYAANGEAREEFLVTDYQSVVNCALSA